jgi:hypothetical protein
VSNHHPFGCPAYALDGDLQNGKKIPKWVSRARVAVYLGHSPQHARTVGLLLSLTTGLVSPQFHVRYDNLFETVKEGHHQTRSQWQIKCGFDQQVLQQHLSSQAQREINESSVIPSTEVNDAHHENHNVTNPEATTNNINIENPNREPTNTIHPANNDLGQPTNEDRATGTADATTVTRAGRTVRLPNHLQDYVVYESNVTFDNSHPLQYYQAFAASSDPDIMYLHEAMKQPDRIHFIKAMEDEVRAHTENGNWIIVDRKSVPKNQPILPSVWAMRRKRDIATQQVYKWKARLNVHGGKQIEGVNYWETYAPVATWSSIRLIMTMAALNNWSTKQLDFVLAFPQAPVETDIYMEIPDGFALAKGTKKDKVLKLVNNLYGQKQAGRVWNNYSSEGLRAQGFNQCANDPCIFWRKETMIVIYTDDTIVTGPDSAQIDQAIADIGTAFKITHQMKVDDFLGVKIERDEITGTVKFSQPHLINSMLRDLGLKDNSNPRRTPAVINNILHRFIKSQPHSENWDYRSVVGKLNYLEK